MIYRICAGVAPNATPKRRNLDHRFCDDQHKTIYIYQGLKKYLLKKVLCHEITHAAMYSYNINLSLEQEELLADLLSTYGEEIIEIANRVFAKLIGRYV